MERNKRSNVWNYFDKLSDAKVVCKLCDVRLVYRNSTGAMNNHLKLRHPSAQLQTVSSSKVQQSMETFAKPVQRRSPPSRVEELTSLITDKIATYMLPIAFIEGEGFRRLMRYVQPAFVIPRRK